MSKQENPVDSDYLNALLIRLRKKMVDQQDSLDITSFAIRTIEKDLENIQQQDGVANENAEKNA
jgi:hypothetical protein